ncbi:MAG: shikimate dehydrogenase [Flavobacteriales bacterium]|jgi:shikimate dehydrogenase|nr:shikimate dehydrogenase [Flavobacteriales bacterium]
MKSFGLIGQTLSHSFSKKYFKHKFSIDGISNCDYNLYELETIKDFSKLIQRQNFSGLNVTMPYKEHVIPFLDELTPEAKSIGAVNCIEFANNKLIGHNTDAYGFRKSLCPLLKNTNNNALILGSGGASKAVKFVLNNLNINSRFVSRKPTTKSLGYKNLSSATIASHKLIINTTPLGTYPNINSLPSIPYEGITKEHILFDLVYNPDETAFLTKGKMMGCIIKNGREMLELQAEKSWAIWNTISPKI